jgi:NitT/TauT family transport system permease protein
MIWAALPIAGVLIVWELLVRLKVIDSILCPPPTAVLGAALRLLKTGELGTAVGGTLLRLSIGFGIGAMLGLALGLFMGAFKIVRRTFEPLISALNSTPKLTLLPMLMLFLGIGDAPRITLIALSALIVLAMHGLDAVRGIHPAYVDLARNNNARSTDLLWNVYLPASLPQIFTGFRIAVGRALVITVTTELIGGRNGLGNLIWMGWQTFAVEKLYTGVIVTTLLGTVLHWGLVAVEEVVAPWSVKQRAVI